MMHRDTWIMPRLTDSERAMLRSQRSGIVISHLFPSQLSRSVGQAVFCSGGCGSTDLP